MRRLWIAAAVFAFIGCGPTSPVTPFTNRDSGPAPSGSDSGTPGPVDSGQADAGGGTDAGRPDAGRDAGVDAGVDGGIDAGHDAGVDAGTDAGVTYSSFPSIPNWTFLGPANGGTTDDVYAVSADEGGNIWVAGGTDGLFLLQPGATTFRRFTLKDGLHPYGYLPDGGSAATTPYLKVISVAGGPAGTVFVGYQGKDGCEDNWDTANPDPDIYKSGDADKVTLTGTGISVVHYDIFSGPGIVPNEQAGREKLCNILRIRYDTYHHAVWFGGNHGFAWGDPDFEGAPTCDGELNCSGLWEHSHPAFSGVLPNGTTWGWITDSYYGVEVNPASPHDIWFGGANRTTSFKFGTGRANGDSTEEALWYAQSITEASPSDGGYWDRIDIWPDPVGEWAWPNQVPTYADWGPPYEDDVTAIAGMPDGSAWVASLAHGLAHLSEGGSVIGYMGEGQGGLLFKNLSAAARDTSDDSLWVGYAWGGGMTRFANGQATNYSNDYLGNPLANSTVADIEMMGSGSTRKVLVLFSKRNGGTMPPGLGIYSGK